MAKPRKRWRDRRSFRVLVALVASSYLYVAGFGPACWLCAKGVLPAGPVGIAYWPVVYHGHHHGPVTNAINAYADFWGGKPYIIEKLRDAAAKM